MNDLQERKDFMQQLSEFYEALMGGFSDSVETLAELQEDHEEEYEAFAELQKDPYSFDNLEELSEEEKETLLTMVMRVNRVSSKFNRLFDLSVDEKRELSEEMENLKKQLQENAEEIAEQLGEKDD